MSENMGNFENQCFHKLSKYVKSNYKQGIIDCLTLLKNDQKCSKIILKGDGLNQIIKFLSYQNTQIMNLTLSILADACLSADIRHKVQETKIVSQTLWIINNLKIGNTLHCRACRLIGNLCKSTHYAKSFHDAGVAKSLASLLNEKTNTSTYLMAVRAIRNIWHNWEKSRINIINHNIINSITRILESTNNDSSDSNQAELAEACLKAICTFLSTPTASVGNQLRGSKDELGYRTLVKYCESNNKLAIQCMYSLCQIAECRPDLGKCGAIKVTIALVSKDYTLTSQTLAMLCLFCREAINRYRVRIHSGLELMLSLLKNQQYEKYHLLLLHALTTFVYDDDSVAIMLKNGLVDIIMQRLNIMNVNKNQDDDEKEEEEEEEDEETNVKKRCKESSTQITVKQPTNKMNWYSLDYFRDDWSPRSSTSGYYSPPSSSPMTMTDKDDIDENAEENYSPVCSDNEFNESDESKEEVESLNSVRSKTYDPEEIENMNETEVTVLDNCSWTLILLSRLSYLDGPVEKLADPCIIEPLVSYIKSTKSSKALRILVRIARNSVYLIPLVKQGFVFEAQTMYGSEQYTRLLCNLAATGGAVGELTTILMRGQEFHKYITAVSIPFLITSRYTLRSLLNDHGGLSLIFQILNDNKHQLYEKAIWSICRLADSLKIQPEMIEKSTEIPEKVNHLFNQENSTKPTMVTFELDDGTTIDACRRTLCQRSDAFTAMLEGNFSESGKRRIKLKNTSKESLNTLLLALDGAEYENNAIESLLDAVLLADKFLMTGVSDVLTESSMSKLNHENYSRAWNWARKNSCIELKSCCVKSFLTTKMTRVERSRAFRDFSACEESFAEFLEEIKEIINSVLCQR